MNTKANKFKTGFIPGTFVTAYLLFGTRWVSHLGISPLFVTDLLVGLSCIGLVITLRGKFSGVKLPKSWLFRLTSLSIFGITFWAVLRFILGQEFNITAVRDLAPYIYPLVAFIAMLGYWASSKTQIINSISLIYLALVLHLIWISFALFVQPVWMKDVLISPAVHLFEIRADVDMALLGVLSALSIVLATKFHRWSFILYLVSGWSWFILMGLDSRAGLISGLVSVAMAIVWISNRKDLTTNRKIQKSGFALATIAIFAFLAVPQSSVQNRFIGLSGVVEQVVSSEKPISDIPQDPDISNASSEKIEVDAMSGAGTAGARVNAWKSLVSWELSNPERSIIGIGFGDNFMITSGAGELLLGNNDPRIESVRSPHNYLLGTQARIGLVGTLLVLLFGICYLILLFRYFTKNRSSRDILLFLAAVVPAAFVPIAFVGVVLESPFGAIPFWWASGILIAGVFNQRLSAQE